MARMVTAIILTALTLAAAAMPAVADEANPEVRTDPLEPLNRITSGFNFLLRKTIIDPAVDLYQFVTPDPLEKAISNAASNLSEPITAGGSLLQGDLENAGNATKRFLINSTVGVAGLGDPAGDLGIDSRREDLGQSLGAHGVGTGPHLVLPILGPSNFRDALGTLTTSIANPLPLAANAAAGTVAYSGKQDAYSAIGDNALDSYIAEREAYEQNRTYEVRNGDTELPGFDETPLR